ncbi:MAG: hypothetical protein HY423_16185 [Candidatus Lambdaproteobacteria bacterium]|nr:hypothetical protein [Candidatus Lambdaproteobacteria bacterium]
MAGRTARFCPRLLLALALASLSLAGARGARAQERGQAFAPGFGLLAGEGTGELGGAGRRFGFSSRRLREHDRIGSLALVAEEWRDAVAGAALSGGTRVGAVRVESVYAEIKRYLPVAGGFHYYWGLRGGVTRLRAEIASGAGAPARTIERDSVAPLALLALPLALEQPGFLLLALVDGASAGVTFDLVADRIWLDFQVGAQVLPRYRDRDVAFEELFLLTRAVQLVVTF